MTHRLPRPWRLLNFRPLLSRLMSSDDDTRSQFTTQDVLLLFRGVPARHRLAAISKRELEQFAQALCTSMEAGPFTCLITNDRELRRMNAQFLGHDYPTDVLSFPSTGARGSLGEMAISIERAAEQACRFGHAIEEEIRILMLHGFLHLTGLDHERDRGEMARAERKWRSVFSLPATLIVRSNAARSTASR